LGGNGSSGVIGNGGSGVSSLITGSSVGRGGGGAGGYSNSLSTGGTATDGGGGSATNDGVPGVDGKGGGGGGGGQNGTRDGGKGGDGVVILKYPDTVTISNPGGGLTISAEASSGGFKVVEIIDGTGNVSWS
jgi:hypothetical protein